MVHFFARKGIYSQVLMLFFATSVEKLLTKISYPMQAYDPPKNHFTLDIYVKNN